MARRRNATPLDDGDIPTPESALGLFGRDGPVCDLELHPADIEGLSASARLARQRKVIFLRAFAQRGIISDGLRAAGVSRTLVSAHWLKEDTDWFVPLYKAALEEAADNLEAEATRRAVEGVDEPIVYQGMMTTVTDEAGNTRPLTVKKYSDNLLQMLLKGRRREVFGDRLKAEVDVRAVGVLVVPGMADPNTWEDAAREQQAKYAGQIGEDDNGEKKA